MSTTYIALLVNALVFVAPHFGFEVFNPESLMGFAAGLVGLAATAYAFYGRYRAGGINALGLRKS